MNDQTQRPSPAPAGLTRRQASAAIGSGVLGAAGGFAALGAMSLGPARAASAQPMPASPVPPASPAAPPARGPSPLDRLMERSQLKSRDVRWIVDVFPTEIRSPDAEEIIVKGSFNIETAAMFLPIVESSASSSCSIESVAGEVEVNNKAHAAELSLLEPMQTTVPPVPVGQPSVPVVEPSWGQGGVRYARWALRDAGGGTHKLTATFRTVSWQTTFDQEKASKIAWPATPWPASLRSALGTQAGVNPRLPEIQQLLHQVTAGKDPKSIPPMTLAKFLCAELVNRFQISGSGLQYDRGGRGRPGGIALEGYELFDLGEVMELGRGAPHTLSAALCSLYRAAGLPARIVLAHDATGAFDGPDNPLLKSRSGKLVSWVEFCLFDPDAPRELWVPVDPVQLRSQSSRAPDWRRPWRKYFGTHDKLADAVPLGFHFVPPFGGATTYGGYGLWGWLTQPTIASNGLQRMLITSVTTARRSGDDQPERRR